MIKQIITTSFGYIHVFHSKNDNDFANFAIRRRSRPLGTLDSFVDVCLSTEELKELSNAVTDILKEMEE